MLRRLAPYLAGIGAIALYLATMSPGLYWGDSAQLQLLTARPSIDIGVRDYPLWIGAASVLTRLLGCAPTTGANLFGVLCGGAAVALCFALTRRLTGSRFGAAVAAATLAFSHLLWSSSTAAEVYPGAAALILLLLLILSRPLGTSRRTAFLFGLVAGISLLHHRQVQVAALAMLVPFLFRPAAVRPLRANLLAAAGGLAVGALPVLVLFAVSDRPLSAQIDRFLLGSFELGLPSGLGLGRGLVGLLLYEIRFLLLNLAGPQLLFAALGLRWPLPVPGPWRARLLCVAGASALFPLLFPHLGDRFVLLLPAVCVFSVLAGAGAAALLDRRARAVRLAAALAVVAAPVAAYTVLGSASAIQRAGFFEGATPAHRRAFLWPPRRGDRRAEQFGERVFAALPDQATVYSGWGDGEVLRYVQTVRGVRPDVTLRPYPRRWRHLEEILASSPTRRFFSSYPDLPIPVAPPPGLRLVEIVPRALWELRPAGRNR